MGARSGCNYNSPPSPVAAFTGSATQACPFEGWGLSSLFNYSYYYYRSLYNQAYYMLYYYGYSRSYVKWWLEGCMCEYWRNA